MNGFIKRFSDFATTKTFRAVEWDVALRSTEDEVSTVVVVAGDVDAGDVGDWLIMAGALLRIESVQIGTSTTSVKCRDLPSAFARTLLIQDIMEDETVATFIMDTLSQQFESADDEAYAIPYLSITSTTEGDVAYHPPETDAYGRFSFDEYLRSSARVHNIHLSWSISGADTLKITVGRGDIRGGQIVLGAGTDQLAEDPVFANTDVAKITVLQPVESEEDSESVTKTDYYLYTDGTFGTSATGGERAEGGWEYITASASDTADDVSEKVAQQFERGMSDSKISFWSELDLTVGAPVVLRVNDRRYSGYVSHKGVKSTDKRYFYRCGNRPVTLTEKLRAVEKTAQTADSAKGSSNSSSGGSGSGSGTSAVTSVNGETGDVTIGPEVVDGEDITPSSVTATNGAIVGGGSADGYIGVRNSVGKTVAQALSFSNAGYIRVDASGDSKGLAILRIESGSGVLQLRDSTGYTASLTATQIAKIGASAVESVNGATGAVTVGPEVVDGQDITPSSVKASCDGNVVAALYQTGDGRGVLALRNKDYPNQDGVQAYALTNGGGGLLTRNGDGNTAVTLSASAADMQANAGAAVTFDASGNKRTVLGTNTDGDGMLRLIDSSGGEHDLTTEKIDQIGASVNPYPVGSIYLSVVDTSPETLFGGTWERLKDTFLLAAGDSYAAGDTGGEATHKLTVSEMPSHTHQFGNYYTMAYNYSSGGKRFVAAEVDDLCNGLQKTGGDTAHNNMPPYLAVYMWKRTA